MATNSDIISILVDGIDCKGLYFKDKLKQYPDKKKLTDKDIPKGTIDILEFVIKIYTIDKKIKKRTLTFQHMTFLRAVKEASARRRLMIADLKDGKNIIRDITFNRLFEEYLKFKGKSISEKNHVVHRSTHNKHIAKTLGIKNISSITTNDFQLIVNKMLNDGYKPATVQRLKSYYRPCFKYAIQRGYTDHNPAIDIQIPKFDNTVDVYLTDDEIKRLYKNILEYEIEPYRGILVFLFHGRRFGEVNSLLWDNINLKTNEYTIISESNKIRKNQTYIMTPVQIEALKTQRHTKSGLVFSGIKDNKVTLPTFKRHWVKVLNRTGIKIRLHDLRHLLGTTMVNNGESLESIGKALGHSNSNITKRYAKTTKETAHNVVSGYLNLLSK